MIEFKKISKFYPPDTYALRDVNLKIEAGEFVSVVGLSGAGKTTLSKLLIAQEKPTKGKIIIDGWDITDIRHGEVPILRRQIGVIFQEFNLLPGKTVFENVAFALEVCGASMRKIKDVVPQILKIVGLEDRAEYFPHHLSGGEKQRVAIARSLAHQPKILIADEPTGNLDSFNTQDIADLLKRINELGTTVILVTHNQDMVNYFRQRVIILDSGLVVKDQEKGTYEL